MLKWTFVPETPLFLQTTYLSQEKKCWYTRRCKL